MENEIEKLNKDTVEINYELEKINDKAQLDEKKVLESIKAVTGFDMGDRLDSYQTFKGREEGIKKYKDIIASNPDDKAFISAWNRLLEIQMQKFSFRPLEAPALAARM